MAICAAIGHSFSRPSPAAQIEFLISALDTFSDSAFRSYITNKLGSFCNFDLFFKLAQGLAGWTMVGIDLGGRGFGHGSLTVELDRIDKMNGMDSKAASWPPHSKTQASSAEQNTLSVM